MVWHLITYQYIKRKSGSQLLLAKAFGLHVAVFMAYMIDLFAFESLSTGDGEYSAMDGYVGVVGRSTIRNRHDQLEVKQGSFVQSFKFY